MASIDYTKLNEILLHVNNLHSLGEVVEEKTNEENDYEGAYFVVKLNEEKYGKDMFIKVDEYTDSYGNNKEVTSVQFVVPTRVVVTDFRSL